MEGQNSSCALCQGGGDLSTCVLIITVPSLNLKKEWVNILVDK